MAKRNLQSWPEDAGEWVIAIDREVRRLCATIKTTLSEGMEQKNYGLVRVLIPRITQRAEAIQEAAKRIAALYPSKPGNPPKWFNVAMETVALASRMQGYTERTAREMSRGRWLVVGALIVECDKDCKAIARHINSIPMDAAQKLDSIPDVFYQAWETTDE